MHTAWHREYKFLWPAVMVFLFPEGGSHVCSLYELKVLVHPANFISSESSSVTSVRSLCLPALSKLLSVGWTQTECPKLTDSDYWLQTVLHNQRNTKSINFLSTQGWPFTLRHPHLKGSLGKRQQKNSLSERILLAFAQCTFS